MDIESLADPKWCLIRRLFTTCSKSAARLKSGRKTKTRKTIGNGVDFTAALIENTESGEASPKQRVTRRLLLHTMPPNPHSLAAWWVYWLQTECFFDKAASPSATATVLQNPAWGKTELENQNPWRSTSGRELIRKLAIRNEDLAKIMYYAWLNFELR